MVAGLVAACSLWPLLRGPREEEEEEAQGRDRDHPAADGDCGGAQGVAHRP
jgi:hypothetical protein